MAIIYFPQEKQSSRREDAEDFFLSISDISSLEVDNFLRRCLEERTEQMYITLQLQEIIHRETFPHLLSIPIFARYLALPCGLALQESEPLGELDYAFTDLQQKTLLDTTKIQFRKSVAKGNFRVGYCYERYLALAKEMEKCESQHRGIRIALRMPIIFRGQNHLYDRQISLDSPQVQLSEIISFPRNNLFPHRKA